jgi:hypothetical protein
VAFEEMMGHSAESETTVIGGARLLVVIHGTRIYLTMLQMLAGSTSIRGMVYQCVASGIDFLNYPSFFV